MEFSPQSSQQSQIPAPEAVVPSPEASEPSLEERKSRFKDFYRVLRPGQDRMKLLLAAGIIGIAGGMATDNAEAGIFNTKSLENSAKTAIISAGAGILNQTAAKNGVPFQIQNQNGQATVVFAPNMVRPPQIDPNAQAVLNAMGGMTYRAGPPFVISHNSNPDETFSAPANNNIRVFRNPQDGLINIELSWVDTNNGNGVTYTNGTNTVSNPTIKHELWVVKQDAETKKVTYTKLAN